MIFQNRQEAGQLLAQALKEYRGADAVVYALPRGGVVLGVEIAKALAIPLDLVITRKIGHPMNPEYAICAISESSELVCNAEERAGVDEAWFAQAVASEREEALRRRRSYLGNRSSLPATEKIAILVDDGIATGLTMLAAIKEIERQRPKEIVVAVPVVPRDTAERLREAGARVVAVDIPELFYGAVGMYYTDFRPVSDEEVIYLMQRDPMLFATAEYEPLAERLSRMPTVHAGQWSADRFANGELQIVLRSSVHTRDCLVLCSIHPPDERLLTVLLLCDTLRKEGAFTITLLAPYLAYTRQDREEEGKSQAISWIGSLMEASGITEVVTVDIHSRRAAELIPVPAVSLSTAKLFAEEIARIGWQDATLVAPDIGAVVRCEEVARELRLDQPIAYMQKTRTPAGVQGILQGQVSRRAVVIDDILDTGGTLIACCEALRAVGTREIIIMVTHGLFTGDRWRTLWELGVAWLYCTDSVPHAISAGEDRLRVLSVFPVLEGFLTGSLMTS